MTPPFARGERIRLLKDNGRTVIAGFEGTVDLVTDLGVIVILDSDPATTFRMYPTDGFGPLNRVVRRFFRFDEIEKIPGNGNQEC